MCFWDSKKEKHANRRVAKGRVLVPKQHVIIKILFIVIDQLNSFQRHLQPCAKMDRNKLFNNLTHPCLKWAVSRQGLKNEIWRHPRLNKAAKVPTLLLGGIFNETMWQSTRFYSCNVCLPTEPRNENAKRIFLEDEYILLSKAHFSRMFGMNFNWGAVCK